MRAGLVETLETRRTCTHMNPHAAQHARTSRTRRYASRRGLTLLEILLAVVMLVLVTTSITAAINALVTMEANSRKRVAGCELANRILLTYLDDDKNLPSPAMPLDYGKDRYFYKIADWSARMTINTRQEGAGQGLQGLNRYKVVRVTIFESDESGEYPLAGDELAHIERVVDPANARNPDTMRRDRKSVV